MAPTLRLLRPKQWSKNLLVFAAILFAGRLQDPTSIRGVLVAFLCMCLVSSVTYIANDLRDRERDRGHPRKRLRPIASGEVAVSTATALMVGLAVLGFGLTGVFLNRESVAVLIGYGALQVAYNLGLKHVPVADVFTIAIGFVLRAVLGAAAITVPISGWLLFCTGALALMLGFGKRRAELIAEGAQHREALQGYTLQILDTFLTMFAIGAAMCYGIYSLDSETARRFPGIVLTSLFVCYGICRYVYIALAKSGGEEPESLLFRDRQLQLSIALFLVTAIAAMAGYRPPFLSQ